MGKVKENESNKKSGGWGAIRDVWQDIVKRTRGVRPVAIDPKLPGKDRRWIKEQIRNCLEARGGEVAARGRAAQLGHTYASLDEQGKKRFLKVLVQDFDVDFAAVQAQAKTLLDEQLDETARLAATQEMAALLKPARMKLLQQFTTLPDGVKFLIDLRAENFPWSRKDPLLAILEKDLRNLLTDWFDIGFLELKRLTWSSPASLLEKLIEYEAVHEIRNWTDLKNRMRPDRRVYAYFHPRMPGEPLIFIEVALTKGIPDNIHGILNQDSAVIDPNKADTAVFYSITSAQRGLAGVSLGDFLIKRVVELISREFGNIEHYCTLSPIPGFMKWLNAALASEGAQELLEKTTALSGLDELRGMELPAPFLQRVLADNTWIEDPALEAAIMRPLSDLCLHYLAVEKRQGMTALDKVAHFHLSNGARIERVNWRGNVSEAGLKSAAGFMVNYLYNLEQIERNHEAYVTTGEIKMSSALRRRMPKD